MATSVPTQTEMAKERKGAVVTEDDAKREMEVASQREEERRDLLSQVDGIEQDESEIQFIDTSPRRPMAIIYATLDGEPLVVTRKRARILFQRRLPDGRPMFRAPQEDGSRPASVPEYKKGNEKCFLHKNSPDRELMDSLGLQGKFCPAGQLANAYAKHIHESQKHVKTWEIWEKHTADVKEAEAIKRQDRQFEATMQQNEAIMELARSNQPTTEAVTRCHSCKQIIEGKLADHSCAETA